MKKITTLFILANLVITSSVFAQLNYTVTVSTPGFTPLVSPTNISDFGCACGDEIVSPPLNIGFTFMYDGVAYTQFEVSDNGQLFLGAPAYSCSSNCGPSCSFSEMEPANLSGGTDRNVICPLWDDLGFNNCAASVNYLLAGSPGSMTMTIEWLLMDWKVNNTGSPHGGISFQVVLYESVNGQIDFIYRRDPQPLGSGTQAPHAKIGLMGAAGDFYSTDETGTVLSKVTEYIVAAKPVDGVQFRWSDLNTTHIKSNGMSGRLLVFPNPASDNVFIDLKDIKANSIEMYNGSGARVYFDENVNRQSAHKIDVGSFPAGIYFVKINTDGAPLIKRVIKSK